MITLTDAITSLRPNTEWTMNDGDVDNIIWHTDGTKPLSQSQVDAEMARLEAQAVAKAENDAAATTAAIAHAKSLGFTDAMIAVMYPNLGGNNE